MNASTYQFDILRADRARDLHWLQAEVNADDRLTSDEKDNLSRLIREKFSRLNRVANGPAVPSFRSV